MADTYSQEDDYLQEEELDGEYSDSDEIYHDDGDDELLVSDDEEMASPATSTAQSDCQILNHADLSTLRDSIMAEVAPLIGLPAEFCYPLLSHFKWKKELLLEKFLDPSTPDERKLIQKLSLTAKIVSSPKTGKGTSCLICFDEGLAMRGLDGCKHWICQMCWNLYLKERITGTRHSSASIHCPASNCALIVSEVDIQSLFHDEYLWMKNAFLKMLLSDFVRASPNLKWCPGADCQLGALLPQGMDCFVPGAARVNCKCQHVWCFNCAEEWHEPTDCRYFKAWLVRCADDSETYNWINAYTKDCPKCKSAIEKNGGCNLMACRSCSAQFCWLCLADWSTHSDHFSCNRYKRGEVPKEDDTVQQSRESLRRYLHYFDRYKNHQESMKLEGKLEKAVAKKAKQMEDSHEYSFVDIGFLKKSVQTLHECRRTLSYSYAFAFYLSQGSNQTVIFENNQEDLESATEKLSRLLETDLDMKKSEDGNLENFKLRVMNQARYVDQRRRILLEHCRDGREKNQWVYDAKSTEKGLDDVGGSTSSEVPKTKKNKRAQR